MSPVKYLLAFVFLMLCCLDGFAQRASQDADTDVKSDIKNTGDSSQKVKLNTDTIYIMTGAYTGTYLRIGADISAVMDGKNGLRVLPVLTAGSVKNMKDILYLNGIDVGIIQADVLGYLESEEGLSNLKERVSYISKLYNEEAHLVSLKSVKNIRELQGKKVNCGKAGSGTYVTCVTVFRKLDITVTISDQDDITAFEKLKNGEIDALFFVAGKPAEFGKQIPSGNYHFLSIPYEDHLQAIYLPSSLTSEDYPNLIPSGHKIPTIATSAVMAVYNWPRSSTRYIKVEKFIMEFFSRFDEFTKEPRHPKWREVNIAANLPGWNRFAAAQDWLNAGSQKAYNNKTQQPSEEKEKFRQFIKNHSSDTKKHYTKEELEQLFQQYRASQKKQ